MLTTVAAETTDRANVFSIQCESLPYKQFSLALVVVVADEKLADAS